MEMEKSKKFWAVKISVFVIIILFVAICFFVLGRFSVRKTQANRLRSPMRQLEGKNFVRPNGRDGIGKKMAGERMTGEITKIDGDNLMVKIDDKEYTVVIPDSTSIQSKDEILKKSDLKVGNDISIMGTSDANGQIQAKAIIVNN